MSNTSSVAKASVATLVLACGLAVAAATAQERAGRYTMTPADGGFIRLDTESGAMSLCARKADGWACEAMPDSVAAMNRDLDALKAENKALKDEIRRLEETFGLAEPGKTDPGKKAEVPPDARPGGKLQLPTEKDVDQAMDYMTRMLRKFRDKLKELESEKGGGTPL